MTEFISTIFDDSYYLAVVTFGGLYFSVFLIGYFISLLISLLNKIIRS
jgi:hypothetical protein